MPQSINALSYLQVSSKLPCTMLAVWSLITDTIQAKHPSIWQAPHAISLSLSLIFARPLPHAHPPFVSLPVPLFLAPRPPPIPPLSLTVARSSSSTEGLQKLFSLVIHCHFWRLCPKCFGPTPCIACMHSFRPLSFIPSSIMHSFRALSSSSFSALERKKEREREREIH